MPVYKNPYFLLPVLLFWVNQYLERIEEVYLPFIHSYWDDLLAMPVILGITLQFYRWIHPLKAQLVFSPVQVLAGWLYVSLIFEYLLPRWSDRYTADLWDVCCYLLGSVYFYFLINRNRI
ncbi:magnesium citrate secondary transporter [Cyclobacterium roseum]|uniref:magnesium citrate secondary transporter n=1 Tax=Cyclobacterium roseum TaxID=2666137 RepID=UPI00139107B2|nr:magnesium citrate secondary transporter [Cyclobacterium roseum]